MTLYTTDYLEYFLTLVSWIVSNGLWATLSDTGLFAVPFFAIILQEWLRARAEGADEGNKGILSANRIETRVWVAVIVLFFAVLPLITVDFSTIQFNTARSVQCQAYIPAGEGSKQPEDTAYGASFTTLNGQSAKLPVWWFMMHAVSRSVTSSAIAAIPCGYDLRQMRMEIDTTRVDDPLLAQEVADFTRDCYAPSRAKMFQDRPNLSDEQLHDVSWPGSKTFLASNDYYGTFNSTKPRADWPYSESRDEGLARVASGGGYPTCSEWWASEDVGLRSRLLNQVEPTLLERFGNWISNRSQEEINDSIIRAVIAPAQQHMTSGRVYADYGGMVDHSFWNATARLGSDLGAAAGALGYFPAMDKVRQALPMVLSFIKLGIVVSIPFVLVMSTYGLKALTTVTLVYFAIFFVEFWFQLARYLDSTIIDAMYGGGSPHSSLNPLMGLNNAMGDIVLNYVMASTFIFLPLLWMGALSWAGIAAGNALQGLQGGTSGVQKAGGSVSGGMLKGGKG
ncbi:conjugal transfer protein TraG N-terminal domain-containing protein [Stutzerimonas stutzeri]